MQNFQIKTEQNENGGISGAMSDFNQNIKEQKLSQKARTLGIDYVNLNWIHINSDLASLITKEESQTGNLIPFFKIGKKVRIAVLDPQNPQTIAVIQKLKENGYKININLCTKESLVSAQDLYHSHGFRKKTDTDLSIEEKNISTHDAEVENLSAYADKLETLQADALLSLISGGVIKTSSSDVHIQPEEKFALLRFRIDGVLKTIFKMPNKVYEALIKQIKYESRLKFNITHLPQDGQFHVKVNDTKIDVRVSTLPTEFGETIVMRFLDPKRGIVKLSDLGIQGRNLKTMEEAIKIPNGMILVTGPTGSGKTTTLYSILNQINSPEKKVITLEDPIEYHLAGISQSQVEEEKGYTFALGLRSILRQDPDIVMVGEIRDNVTAETAAQAALTGHLVLSTLHTNSAIETIPRLVNMGLKPFILAPALNVLIAQRLVRRLCQHCAERKTPSQAESEYLQKHLQDMQKRGIGIPELPEKLLYPVGCPKCSQTGFHGQIALIEVLKISDEIEDMILAGISSVEILHKAMQQGMITLEEDGIIKILENMTCLSEVGRVS